jgi:hypothetical protein
MAEKEVPQTAQPENFYWILSEAKFMYLPTLTLFTREAVARQIGGEAALLVERNKCCSNLFWHPGHPQVMDGLFIPREDRRIYAAWSERQPDNFPTGFWHRYHRQWLKEGSEAVAAYLATLDLGDFDPGASPPKTATWHEIVAANEEPADAELLDVLDNMNYCDFLECSVRPNAVTLDQVANAARSLGKYSIADLFAEKNGNRKLAHRLESCGYVSVRSEL